MNTSTIIRVVSARTPQGQRIGASRGTLTGVTCIPEIFMVSRFPFMLEVKYDLPSLHYNIDRKHPSGKTT